MKRKVFGIGFHKTATSSLANALRALGYRVTGPNGVNNAKIADQAVTIAKRLAPRFDAFVDNPWPVLFQELDEMYPESQFILTLRDPEKWIKSVVNHFGNNKTPMRQWIYSQGSPLGHEALYLERYLRHNEAVLNHFQGQDKLLVMDITAGDDWEKLCPFLNLATPATAFPHANTAASRNQHSLGKAIRRMRKTLRNRWAERP